MKKGNNQSIYRPLLWRALATAWTHKELWPFALFAGFASTGVVVNDVLHQAQIALRPVAGSANAIGSGVISFFQKYLSTVIASGTMHIAWATIGAVIMLASAGFILILCQQILLVAMHRAVHKKKQLTGREILRTLHHHHFLRILGVDLFFHVMIFIVLGGGALLIRELPLTVPAGGATAILLAAATLFVAFVLNVIAMLTLIAVGQEHVSILRGMQEGVQRFLRHPLVACEVAILLFATNLGMSVMYLFGLTALSIPVGILFAETLATGSYAGMIAITFAGVIGAVLFTLCSAGFMTTFTYASWTMLVEYLDRAPFVARVHHYTRKVFTKRESHDR
jgi:hypothetical protein